MKIERVTDIAQLPEIRGLLYHEYLRKKYIEPNKAKELDSHPLLDVKSCLYSETRTVRVDDDNGVIVGTASMTLDGSEGLPTDLTFADEMQTIRDECQVEGKTLGAVWRLAIKEANTDSVVVGMLFDEIEKWLHERCVNVLLFDVHPGSHEKFYKRFMGATLVGEAERQFGLTDNAPAVLLRLDEVNFGTWKKYRSKFFAKDK